MQTTKFQSGAVRSADAADVRYDLISPIALESLARTCAEGAKKYDDFNWEKGMPVGDILNHGIRHLYQFLAGDRSEDHLGHALWNVAAAIHSHALWPHLNAGTLREPGCVPPGMAQPETAISYQVHGGRMGELVNEVLATQFTDHRADEEESLFPGCGITGQASAEAHANHLFSDTLNIQ